MNADTKWNVHPSYVDIIKQLSPDEAKYLRILPNHIYMLHPLIDVNCCFGEEAKGTNPIISNFTNYNIDKLEHPKQICSCIDNLARLNLIEIPPEQHLANESLYKELEEHPFVQNPLKVAGGITVKFISISFLDCQILEWNLKTLYVHYKYVTNRNRKIIYLIRECYGLLAIFNYFICSV